MFASVRQTCASMKYLMYCCKINVSVASEPRFSLCFFHLKLEQLVFITSN